MWTKFDLKFQLLVRYLLPGLICPPKLALVKSACYSALLARNMRQGCHSAWKSWKVLELAKENSRPWKVLEFGLRSLKILEWSKFLTFNSKKKSKGDICHNQTWHLRCDNVWKQKRRHKFSPEANLVNLIAEFIYRILKLFWCKRPLNLLGRVLGSPGEVLEFQIQLTVATLIRMIGMIVLFFRGCNRRFSIFRGCSSKIL